MNCAAALISSAVLFRLSGTVGALTSSLVGRKLKTSSTYNATPLPLFHLARLFAPPSTYSGLRVAFFLSADPSRAPSYLSQSYKQASPLAFNMLSPHLRLEALRQLEAFNSFLSFIHSFPHLSVSVCLSPSVLPSSFLSAHIERWNEACWKFAGWQWRTAALTAQAFHELN